MTNPTNATTVTHAGSVFRHINITDILGGHVLSGSTRATGVVTLPTGGLDTLPFKCTKLPDIKLGSCRSEGAKDSLAMAEVGAM